MPCLYIKDLNRKLRIHWSVTIFLILFLKLLKFNANIMQKFFAFYAIFAVVIFFATFAVKNLLIFSYL